jgi:multidrug efflux pump subunit AcrA (membrane-fusion protein)
VNASESSPQGPKWRRTLAMAAGVTVVLAVVLAFAALRRPDGVETSVTRAARRDLVVPLLSDGTLEPAPSGEIRAEEHSTVAAVRVKEGARVTKGMPLVELSVPALAKQARDARALAEGLMAERARVAGELDTEKAEALRLQRVFEADGRLLAEGAIPRATRDADEVAAKRAREKVGALEAELASLSGPGSRLELARATAEELERRVAALMVRAPADGVAYGLPRRPGESIEAGQLVANVADPDHLRVRVRVDQPDLPRVAAGQPLVVTFDGLPDRRWEGRVTVVSPGLREVAGRQVGEVLGEIADPTASLPPNASVNVSIVVAEKKGALLVPRGAVQRDGERRFVWVDRDGRARRADVTLGVIGANDVEIVTGLAEGDRVLQPGASPLSDGVRVSHRAS